MARRPLARAARREAAQVARDARRSCITLRKVVEELDDLQRVVQCIARRGAVLNRRVRHNNTNAAEVTHHPKGVLIGHIITNVEWEDLLNIILTDLLQEPLDGFALIPISGWAELVHHLTLCASKHWHVVKDLVDDLEHLRRKERE